MAGGIGVGGIGSARRVGWINTVWTGTVAVVLADQGRTGQEWVNPNVLIVKIKTPRLNSATLDAHLRVRCFKFFVMQAFQERPGPFRVIFMRGVHQVAVRMECFA